MRALISKLFALLITMEIAQAVASDMEDAAEWETTVARTEPGKEPRYKASMPHWR